MVLWYVINEAYSLLTRIRWKILTSKRSYFSLRWTRWVFIKQRTNSGTRNFQAEWEYMDQYYPKLNRGNSMSAKKRIVRTRRLASCLKSIVWSEKILKTGDIMSPESWLTPLCVTDQKFEATVMDVLRRFLWIPRLIRIWNQKVPRRVGVDVPLLPNTERRNLYECQETNKPDQNINWMFKWYTIKRPMGEN